MGIQTGFLHPARKPDLVIIYKKQKRTCCVVDFAVPADHRSKIKEIVKKEQAMGCEGDGDTNWRAGDGPLRLREGNGRFETIQTTVM